MIVASKINKCLPWQMDQWQKLRQGIESERFPHAIIIGGEADTGKALFSDFIAAFLFCKKEGREQACGECAECRYYQAGSHPDFRLVEPEKEGGIITVNQIRELSSFFSMSSQMMGYKIAIIRPADRMNTNAANSLLKTLEEPAGKSLIILVSDLPLSLPATIRSRCQMVESSIDDHKSITDWVSQQQQEQSIEKIEDALAAVSGRPLAAIEFLKPEYQENRLSVLQEFESALLSNKNILDTAKKWSSVNTKEVLEFLISWAIDIAIYKSTENTEMLKNRDIRQRIITISNNLELKSVIAFSEKAMEARRFIDRKVNVQLLLEELLVTCSNKK
ncbi:MAG: DNA polymerase III subunit delta' [Gammaproteobacteria bacterium]|nr:MAG: DNA polymerase III subunit delta' [Gammaproteobacteria bacterium]